MWTEDFFLFVCLKPCNSKINTVKVVFFAIVRVHCVWIIQIRSCLGLYLPSLLSKLPPFGFSFSTLCLKFEYLWERKMNLKTCFLLPLWKILSYGSKLQGRYYLDLIMQAMQSRAKQDAADLKPLVFSRVQLNYQCLSDWYWKKWQHTNPCA